MKTVRTLGIIALAASMAFSTAQAGPTVKPVRESLVDYTKEVKKYFYGEAGTAKGVKGTAIKEVKENLLKQPELSSLSSKLRPVLSGDQGAERMDSLVTVIAAKKMSAEIAKQDAAEAKSIENAATAGAKLIANADTIGAKQSADLNATEASLVTSALQKAETLTSRIITDFSKAERDSYTQIIEKFDQLNQLGGKKSAEDSFIQAIMEVKKVDRTKALEIAKKLKECV